MPPVSLQTGIMQFAMVQETQRYNELITHFLAQAMRLGKAQVMSVGGLSPADETGEGAHIE